jgi:hypothetical protein
VICSYHEEFDPSDGESCFVSICRPKRVKKMVRPEGKDGMEILPSIVKMFNRL